jgi:hypothetical protein
MADASSIKDYYQKTMESRRIFLYRQVKYGYSKSPAHTIRTQSNHLYLSMIAFEN